MNEHQWLNSILNCPDQVSFERMSVGVRTDLPRENRINEAYQWIRRRADRRTDYVSSKERLWREFEAWTWIEEKILSRAFDKKYAETREGVEITEEYIADLLQRPVSQIHEKRNIKHGVQGWDL